MSTINNQNEEFNDIFDIGTESMFTQESTGGNNQIDPDYYRPSLRLEDNKVLERYSSIIRLLPDINHKVTDAKAKDFGKPITKYMKYQYYFDQDPLSTQKGGLYLDCPSTVGDISIFSIAYLNFYKHESSFVRDSVKGFSRKQYFWSLCQIIKDVQNLSVQNTVKILRYSKGINEKIELEATEDSSIDKKSVVVFDPMKGKDLVMIIQEDEIPDKNTGVKRKQITYDKSYFANNQSALTLDGGVTRLQDSQESRKLVFEYLKQNSPDMSKVFFKTWTDDDHDRALQMIRHSLQDESLFNNLMQAAKKKNYRWTLKNNVYQTDSPVQQQAPIVSESANVTFQNPVVDSAPKVSAPSVVDGLASDLNSEKARIQNLVATEKPAQNSAPQADSVDFSNIDFSKI